MEEAGTTGFLPGKKICVSEFFWIMLMQITRLSEIKVKQINFLPKMYNVLPVHVGFSRSSKKTGKCPRRSSPGFDPSILRHRGEVDEAVLIKVHKKNPYKSSCLLCCSMIQNYRDCLFKENEVQGSSDHSLGHRGFQLRSLPFSAPRPPGRRSQNIFLPKLVKNCFAF